MEDRRRGFSRCEPRPDMRLEPNCRRQRNPKTLDVDLTPSSRDAAKRLDGANAEDGRDRVALVLAFVVGSCGLTAKCARLHNCRCHCIPGAHCGVAAAPRGNSQAALR